MGKHLALPTQVVWPTCSRFHTLCLAHGIPASAWKIRQWLMSFGFATATYNKNTQCKLEGLLQPIHGKHDTRTLPWGACWFCPWVRWRHWREEKPNSKFQFLCAISLFWMDWWRRRLPRANSARRVCQLRCPLEKAMQRGGSAEKVTSSGDFVSCLFSAGFVIRGALRGTLKGTLRGTPRGTVQMHPQPSSQCYETNELLFLVCLVCPTWVLSRPSTPPA